MKSRNDFPKNPSCGGDIQTQLKKFADGNSFPLERLISQSPATQLQKLAQSINPLSEIVPTHATVLEQREAIFKAGRQLDVFAKIAFGPSTELQEVLQRSTEPTRRMQEALHQALKPTLRMQDSLRRAMEPIIQLQEMARRISEPYLDLQKALQQSSSPLAGLLKELQDQARPYARAIESAAATYKPLFDEIAPTLVALKRLEDAGWLAHYTMPEEFIFGEFENFEELSAAIEAYYVENWSKVRAQFVAKLKGYEIDDDAKQVFEEAMNCYEAGWFRGVPRHLFPEIERLTRQHFPPPAVRKSALSPLQDFAEELTPSDIQLAGYLGYMLFDKLTGHLYASFKTPEDIKELNKVPVPNRHLCLHGYNGYATRQHSINMLIICDFAFQIIDLYVCGKDQFLAKKTETSLIQEV